MKLKQLFAIRAVRLGIMAAFVATFFGAPALGQLTGNQTLQKLDLIEITADVLGVDETALSVTSAEVDTSGVSASVASDIDTDNDGITDSNDECPDTFGTATNGCETDSDADGLGDSEDDCPYEAADTTDGCPADKPDLVVDTLEISDNGLVNVKVKNQGDGAVSSSNFGVYIYIDENMSTAKTWTYSVSTLADQGCLAVGGTCSISPQTVDTSTSHTVRVEVDPNSAIEEEDESNNTESLDYTVDVALPDLEAKTATISSSGLVEVTVENVGEGSVPTDEFHVFIYIDETMTTAKTWTYSLSTLSNQDCLEPGGTCKISPQYVEVDSNHTLRVEVDPYDAIEEDNEYNNTYDYNYVVESYSDSLPDLGVSGLSISSSGLITAIVENYGNGDATEDFGVYIYIDEGTSTEKTWTYSTSTLSNQGCLDAGGTCSISPQTLSTDESHTVRVEVDPSDVIEEADENNNEEDLSYVVEEQTELPDLETSIEVSTTGEVTVGVKNSSDAAIDSDDWNVYIYVDDKTWTYSVSTLSDQDCLEAWGTCEISPQYVDLNADHTVKAEADANDEIEESDETNNDDTYYYYTEATEELPDLSLGSVYIDSSGTVVVEVENTSNTDIDDSETFHIYITIDGNKWTYSTSTLADTGFYYAGGDAEISPEKVSTDESHDIKVEIDPSDVILESNENNNTFDSTVTPDGYNSATCDGWTTDDGSCEDFGNWNWLNGDWCVMDSNWEAECEYDDDTTWSESVCGMDGETYGSEEAALEGGTEVDYWGECGVADRRELYEMRRMLSQNDVEFGEIIERSERTILNLEKYIEIFERYLSEAKERGHETTDLEDVVEDRTKVFEGFKDKVEKVQDEAEEYVDLYDEFFAEGEERYDTVEAGEKGSQYFWAWANKHDFYWKLREVVERKNDPFDDQGLHDLNGREPVKIAFEAAGQDISLDWSIYEDGIYDPISELYSDWDDIAANLTELQGEILDVIEDDEAMSWEEIDDYRWDFEDRMEWLRMDIDDHWWNVGEFWNSEPWQVVDEMWRSVHWARESDFATEEIEGLIAIWQEGEVMGTIKDTFTEDDAQDAVTDLIELRDEKLLPAAEYALEKAEELQNPDPIWYFFEQIMKPTEVWASPKLDLLSYYYYNQYRDSMSSGDQELLDHFFGGLHDFHVDFTEGADDMFDLAGDEFDHFMGVVDEDMKNLIIEKVVASVSADVIKSLVEHDQSMGIGLGHLMNMSAHANNPEKLAEHAANVQVTAEYLSELRSEAGSNASLTSFIARATAHAGVLYGDDADDLRDYLSGLDPANLASTDITSLEELLEKAIASSMEAKYDDGLVAFKDIQEDQWFFDPVSTAKGLGIVSGYKDASGNLTGDYGAADSVTNGEVMKMVMETLGYGGTGSVSGHWSDPYYETAKTLGLDVAQFTIQDDPAMRIYIADLLVQVLDLEAGSVAYSFTDVSSSLQNTINAIASAGIMTGDDGTSRFRPYDGINRAEAATVVTRAQEYYASQQVVTTNLSDLTDSMSNFDAIDVDVYNENDWATTTFQKLGASLVSVLDALKPSIMMIGM
jgi:subtilase family serine protease